MQSSGTTDVFDGSRPYYLFKSKPYGFKNSSSADLDFYLCQLGDRIEAHWISSESEHEASCTAVFNIKKDGTLAGLKIKTPSGNPRYDQDVLNALKTTSFLPLPQLPPNTSQKLPIEALFFTEKPPLWWKEGRFPELKFGVDLAQPDIVQTGDMSDYKEIGQ